MKRYAFVVLSFCAVAVAASTARAGNADVSIKSGGNEYHPETVHIRVGETVTWTNDDRTLLPTNHTVTADDGSFDSGVIGERNLFDYTFTMSGTFTYHCSIHAGMSGTVVVAPRPTRTSTPTVAPTKTVRASPKPSASKSPRASASASSTAASATPSIDPSNVSSNNSSAGTIISIAIVSIAVLIGLGYFVYLRLVRDR